jgi:Calcineurin-like phosphoesterase
VPLARVNAQHLSLWQSAVTEVVRRQLAARKGAEPTRLEVLEHPAVKATDDFVRLRHARAAAPAAVTPDSTDAHALNVHLSGLVFDKAQAHLDGRVEDEQALTTSYWPFSDKDPLFLHCECVYLSYWAAHNGKFLYNDWTIQGGNNPQYGVIQWQLPNDATVGVIGDWGTGMPDAAALLTDLMSHSPDAIIHLGDIYYSGTPAECQGYFVKVISDVFAATNKSCPVFTIPGNHDYYALGYGFFPMLPGLNAKFPTALQQASYFCLRTQDGGWQFLGMDTGRHDANPLDQVDPLYAGPWLEPTEILWHRDKLANFAGATILLSHHQLFTANATINGLASFQREFSYLNPNLLNVFEPFFGKIAAWLWGHEHNFVLFQNGLFGLEKGRLLGASAFEEQVSESPYTVKHPNVPYLDPTKYQLQPEQQFGYYPHAYAIIEFAGRTQPTDPVQVSYYSFPSWYQQPVQNPQSTLIVPEQYAKPPPLVRATIAYGESVTISSEGGLLFVGPLYEGYWNYDYPTISATPVTFQLLSPTGQSGTLTNGAQVLLVTTENAAGSNNRITAGAPHWLYYDSGNGSGQTWTLMKLGTIIDNLVCIGDPVLLISNAYSGQWISPTKDGYLTTGKTGVAPNVPAFFSFRQP